jgi:hypothetical protein
MKESQYIEAYLSSEKRYTLSTFLKYQLGGKAKQYAGKYELALWRAIKRRIDSGEVEPCRSVNGGEAYRRKEAA